MKPFVFQIDDEKLLSPNFHLETFETEDEAIRHARALLEANACYHSVSVVHGQAVIAELSRNAR